MRLQANCIDSTAAPEAVFAGEVNKLKAEKIKPLEQLTLEPYERDHAVVVGIYRWVHMVLALSWLIYVPLVDLCPTGCFMSSWLFKVRPPRLKMVKMSSKTCFVFIAFSESSLLVLSTFV